MIAYKTILEFQTLPFQKSVPEIVCKATQESLLGFACKIKEQAQTLQKN